MALAVYVRSEKKVEKMKSEIRRKFDLKTLFKGSDTSEIISLLVDSILSLNFASLYSTL
jgi:hypothetical protein